MWLLTQEYCTGSVRNNLMNNSIKNGPGSPGHFFCFIQLLLTGKLLVTVKLILSANVQASLHFKRNASLINFHHLHTGFCTGPACFGAFITVFIIMMFAFISTFTANLSTKATYLQ